MLVLALAVSTVGCREEERPPIEVTLGPAATDTTRFPPVTAFAEYWELPGEADELRITLASYEASCEEFVPPPPGELTVTLSVLVPEGQKIAPGEYPWAGHEAHGGEPRRPEHPYVLPFVRVEGRGISVPPGGALKLTDLQLGPHGRVAGVMSLQGESGQAKVTRRVIGAFEARLCRFLPLPPPEGAES